MIEVEITSKHPEITIDLSDSSKKQIEIEIGAPHSGSGYPIYDGPVMVIPEAYDLQILQTEKKRVTENILIFPIPYYETINYKGGNTVYIGD